VPSEYKAAVVTSGEVRALISGDVVSISGITVDALISGEAVLISGQPVLTSGEVALVSGQPVLVSGEVVLVSGQVALVSGQPIIQTKYEETDDGTIVPSSVKATTIGLLYGFDVDENRWNQLQVLDIDDAIAPVGSHLFVLAANLGFDGTNFDRARTVHQATLSGAQVLAGGIVAYDAGPGLLRRVGVYSSGQTILHVRGISGEVVETSGQVALVSGQPVLISGQIISISGDVTSIIRDNPAQTANLARVLAPTDELSNIVGLAGYSQILVYDAASSTWNRARSLAEATISGHVVQAAGLMAHDEAVGQLRRLETIGSGEPILAVGHASGTRTISVSGQLIDSGGQTYTGVAVTFALGKYSRFAVFNTVTRSGASGQTVEVQVQFSEDAGATWYDLVDGPFGSLLYEGEQVGAVGVLRDVQTGKVAGGDLRIFIRTSGQTLDSNDNFTISSFTMLLN